MENQYTTTTTYTRSDVSLGNWVITLILTMIPIVNIILLFVWGFNRSTNPVKAKWAQAMLIILAISIVLGLIFGSYFMNWFYRGGYPAAY